MNTLWLVIKHDAGVTLRQRSFWVMALVVPALLLAMTVAMQPDSDLLLNRATPGDAATTVDAPPRIALVDQAGLVTHRPADFPANIFASYPDETAARAALDSGAVDQVVIIPADYVATGALDVWARDFAIRQSGAGMGVAFDGAEGRLLEQVLRYNLTGDAALVAALNNPTPRATHHRLAPAPAEDGASALLARLIGSYTPYILYFLLLVGSGYVLRSVVLEKENRTVEQLLLSVNPRQLLLGKIAAMSVVVLIQLTVWIGGALLILRNTVDWSVLAGPAIDLRFLLWTLLFLTLGFLVYATAMAVAGALAQTARDGGHMTWLLVIPLMPTLMFGEMLISEPTHPLTLFLSLFPLSAPSAMITRLAGGEVPFWQLAASLAGLALTAFLFVSLAARYFQPNNLLADSRFTFQKLAGAWRA